MADDFLDKRASELSGGEAQIAALIRVLQLAPDVLLLDEPTASLDPASAREIEALVDAWFAGNPARASIWVSHDPEQALRVGARQLTMARGRLADPRERTMNGYQNLSLFDIALSAALIVVNGALSVALKLDLERKLAWAAVRTVVQLLLIGYVLGWVFEFDRWYVVLPLMVVMTLIAGVSASNRGRRTYAGQRMDSMRRSGRVAGSSGRSGCSS